MTRDDPISISRIRCPACGAQMNPHAEKLVIPASASAAAVDWGLGGLVEQIHQCPSCGRVESRSIRPGADGS